MVPALCPDPHHKAIPTQNSAFLYQQLPLRKPCLPCLLITWVLAPYMFFSKRFPFYWGKWSLLLRGTVQQRALANTFCLTDIRAGSSIKHTIPCKSVLGLRCRWTHQGLALIRGTPPTDNLFMVNLSRPCKERPKSPSSLPTA